MASRSRYSGDVDALAMCLKPFATKPDFTVYTEELSAPLNVKRIQKAAGLWRVVHGLHSKLTFADKFMNKVFVKVAELCADDWPRALTEKELVMTRVRSEATRDFTFVCCRATFTFTLLRCTRSGLFVPVVF